MHHGAGTGHGGEVVEVSLAAGERRQLARASVVTAVMALLLVGGALLLSAVPPVAVLLALFALAAVALLLRRIPAFLARQGFRLTATELELFVERRWWFRGWRLTLPRAAIRSVRRLGRVPDRGWVAAARPATPTLVIATTATEPVAAGPTWCTVVPPGSRTPDGELDGDHRRIMLQLGADDDLDRLAADLDRGSGGVSAAPQPGSAADAAESDAAPLDGPGAGVQVSMRLGSVVRWAMVAVITTVMSLVTLGLALSAGPSTAAVAVQITVAAVAVVLLGLVAAFAPRSLASQGIDLGPDGLEVRRDALGWWRGCRGRLDWAEVHEVSGIHHDPGPMVEAYERQRVGPLGRGPGTVVELILKRMPDWPSMPGWARLVPAGVEARKVVADRPRLLIMAGESRTAEQLSVLIRARLAERRIDVGVAETRLGQWIPLPRVGIVGPAAALALIMVIVGWLGWGLHPFANAALWQVTIWPAVPCVAVALLAWILGWHLPLRLARSGIQLEPAGVQLVRQRCLWIGDHRSRLPWAGIGQVRVVSALGALGHGGQGVELELLRPEGLPWPHWAVLRRHGRGLRLLLVTGDLAAARVIGALDQHRPS